MCGRFFIAPDVLDVAELRSVIEQASKKAVEHQLAIRFPGEMRPSMDVPSLALGRDLRPAGFPMAWGWRRSGGGLVINARSETAATNGWFKRSARRRRCLIPASWYYEWRDVGQPSAPHGGKPRKEKYAFRPTGGGAWYLGGIYEPDPDEPWHARLLVLTRPAAENVSFIHDRMPVLIESDDRGAWLDPERPFDDAAALARTDVEYARDAFAL